MFSRFSISDANPTPLRYFFSAGIGGYSPFNWCRGDSFGIGWYFVDIDSKQYGPVPTALFGPRDGWGLECYYNFQLTPWLNVSPDIQLIKPGLGAIAESAFLGGLRINLTF
jgi:porin